MGPVDEPQADARAGRHGLGRGTGGEGSGRLGRSGPGADVLPVGEDRLALGRVGQAPAPGVGDLSRREGAGRARIAVVVDGRRLAQVHRVRAALGDVG